jgi:Leucine-rich repeat (LRR) protein
LNLSGNRLEGLSDGIFSELHKLENLQLSHNLLKNLPDDVFANLTELFVLYLKNNQLEELPLSIENLSNLVQLDVTRNPLIDPIQPLLLTDFSGNRIRAYLQKAVKGMRRGALRMHSVVS